MARHTLAQLACVWAVALLTQSAAAASQQSLNASQDCTTPHTAADSRRPYCFVTDSVSWQAQKILKTKYVQTDLPPGVSAATVQAIRSKREASRSIEALSAISTFFIKDSMRNATLDGAAKVTWGTPLGFDESNNGDKLLIYFHGGFFMLSSCHDHFNVVGPVAKVAGIKVMCVDYPLSPESQFPAALNSAIAAYKYALKQGYKANKIAVMGDSVGGGLAMSLLLAAAREGLELPGAVGLMSPRVEYTKYGDTFTTLTGAAVIICIIRLYC